MRARTRHDYAPHRTVFPFLFGGTFIEGFGVPVVWVKGGRFPFLFGGTFIEGLATSGACEIVPHISLPFRRDFH